jgi:hypothetical protein
MRNHATRFLAVTLAAAMALPVINLRPANAASPTPIAKVAKADDIEFSSRKRHYRHHHGGAAAFGAVAAMFGTIATLAAASRYRDRYYYAPYGYYQPYGYYGGYGYPYGGYPGGYYYR